LVFLPSYPLPCCSQHSRAYSYTLTYRTVLTIVHSDGTYILSRHTSRLLKDEFSELTAYLAREKALKGVCSALKQIYNAYVKRVQKQTITDAI
jgi:hypothetical protein